MFSYTERFTALKYTLHLFSSTQTRGILSSCCSDFPYTFWNLLCSHRCLHLGWTHFVLAHQKNSSVVTEVLPLMTFQFAEHKYIPAWGSDTWQLSPSVLDRTQAAAVYQSNVYEHSPSDIRIGALSRSPGNTKAKCCLYSQAAKRKLEFKPRNTNCSPTADQD